MSKRDLYIKAGGGGTATAVLRDTDNNILSTTPIASGATENITAPDTDLKINGVTEGSFTAGSTIDLQLTNKTPTIINPTVVVSGNNVGVEIPDTTFEVYVNGVFNTTFTQPTLDINVINITN
jgi:hypothetical protein